MVRPVTLPELKKYDPSQKIIEALADAECRALLFSSISEERSAAEFSSTLRIPLSSVYKKLSLLENLALIEVARVVMDAHRKKIKMYKSRIAKAEINIKKPEPHLVLVPN